MAIERFVGVDLAWVDGHDPALSNETGLAALESDCVVIEAGWAQGLDKTLEWIEGVTAGADALMFVDAPLVVDNPTGQRLCERHVGQRYGRWQVSTNTASPHRAGVKLRERLAAGAWTYDDGFNGPPSAAPPRTQRPNALECSANLRSSSPRRWPRSPRRRNQTSGPRSSWR